jgi:C4-dicarboxylate-specific signal transduction histidine kinase
VNEDGFASPPDLGTPGGEARFAALFRYAQVGRCVNAVTRDINNQLGAAMAYAELAGLDKSLCPETRRMLGEIVEAMSRCANLVAHLTEIARPERDRAGTLDPGEMLQRVLALRNYDLRQRQITVESRIAPDLPTLLADAPRVQMALLHLLLNAAEALETCEAPRMLRAEVAPDPAGGVVFSVWNSGPPPPAAVLAALGRPFATTRGGLHFGYGLAAVRAVAALHGGALAYDGGRGFLLRLVRRAEGV